MTEGLGEYIYILMRIIQTIVLMAKIISFLAYFAQSARAVEYADYTSEEGVRPPLNGWPRYDTKQSDGEVPLRLELWGMQSTPSLPLIPGPPWPGMVAPDRALSMG